MRVGVTKIESNKVSQTSDNELFSPVAVYFRLIKIPLMSRSECTCAGVIFPKEELGAFKKRNLREARTILRLFFRKFLFRVV